MDFDTRTVSAGSGLLLVFLVLLLFCNCCRRRRQQQQGIIVHGQVDPRPRGRRQRNARRKWRRRRPRDDEGPILDNEVTHPESTAPPPPPPHQYIITLNPATQMPFQAAHPPPPFAQHQPWQQQQYPQHVSVPIPRDEATPYQQPGGFTQLYAQAQPDMNVFPAPPPPYETEPFPPLPTKRK